MRTRKGAIPPSDTKQTFDSGGRVQGSQGKGSGGVLVILTAADPRIGEAVVASTSGPDKPSRVHDLCFDMAVTSPPPDECPGSVSTAGRRVTPYLKAPVGEISDIGLPSGRIFLC